MAPTRRVGAYAKLAANYAADDALMEAGEAAELLFVRALAFSSTADSDGFITDAQLTRYVGAGMRDARKRADRLVSVGVWERGEGGYQVRSWVKYHETTEERGRARKRDRERKVADRALQDEDIQEDSARIPNGQQADAVRESSAQSLSLIQDRTEQDRTSLPEAAPSGRKRDEIWDAVMEACVVDTTQITSSARSSYNKAVGQLREVGATPGAITLRARRFRQTWPSMSLTPSALAKHWPQLERGHEHAADPIGFAR